MNRLLKLVFAVTLLLMARTALLEAQPFAVPWYKIAGGGGTSSNPNFAISGAVGQYDAGPLMTGGGFGVTGGYWITPVTRNFGVDVSHFQNSNGIPETNWVQMFAQGNRFVFVKASEGLTGPDDPTMTTNVANATAAGLLAGVYHFAHPENRPTTNGAIQEADHFLTYAGSAIGPGMLRPVLDVETTSSNLPPSVMTDWVIAFCQEIVNNRGNGAMPIVYCTQFFANEQFDDRLTNYSLWLRDIGGDPVFGQPPTNGFPSSLGVFSNWSFWQYSDTGIAGGISSMDLDVCHDEFQPLISYLIPSTPQSLVVVKSPATGARAKVSASASISGGRTFTLTSTPGAHFTLITSTSLSLPLNQWRTVTAFTEISPGNFEASDADPTNYAQVFYCVRSP